MEKIILPAGYKPSEDEEYMNPMQLEYFKQKLQTWREELLEESRDTLDHLKEENWNEPDLTDRASVETETSIELRTRDRYRKLIDKIEHTIVKINKNDYGYCEETGEKIGLRRLEARPVATLCIEAQMRHENYEKTHLDEDKIDI
ncbi:RNA polymerase-binding transcription factor DksA [Candidatus Megaera venefica]|uniref:RNA polymerase-binding transcription factor DksA n=1 Tax=Candidatus Megaera venefica TaxID=2055910 RepID=A0ABU5NF26_9RICK|nr:RNA polymerase-binding protein DksA [Candidatus Megaera venefica]MEA0971775.1 RNA polymerase-binding transcription factor DksA [Candidatus Megaera venefica]